VLGFFCTVNFKVKSYRYLFYLYAFRLTLSQNMVMKIKLKSLVVLFIAFGFAACGGIDVVESGTYSGTIKEIEAAKTEIYVSTEDGKTLELYFTDETSLTKDGQTVDFGMMEEGMAVEVEVVKEGKRLDPISVKIME